ncbi:tRNA guanosine(34) transglycosylase Tgt [Granulicella tundricola]|uniref:Queuine tRNA-ribosyltransferase n=1 Tax=Granulicella tundricola (strain ATCC BAA-1859 / DSM 23138 / MP5ACTX9) TaxID=1198114 RepID=E8X5L2_GRATM|nr:tRNA guanosine(34) transglycosylase Tgt [Granulicella tundricola]ADW70639.1 queuine tRNA-ribosyltransferase [Granulicella tundricola MP5ACTX9]
MSLEFEVSRTAEGGGRRGRLALPHGVVETPVFMPVGTAATVKAVPQDTLEVLGKDGVGAQIILANTYHLYLRPGHELIRRMGGVHKFMSWTRPMLTDSGGFQVFSLSKLRKITPDGVEFRSHLDGSKHFFSPEHSMAVQIALGADVMMVFDECVEHPATYERTRESMGLTHAWAARSKDYFKAHKAEVPWHEELGGKTQSLFGIVQGGMYADLRRESAERLVEMDLPGYAIGGLAVGEPREVTREMIARTLEWLPKDKPRYVMGVGYPDEIEEYARMGVDMMDCVLPTRAGRHGLVFVRVDGVPVRLNIKKLEFAEDKGPIDPTCGCMVCSRYSRGYLRHLFASGEALAGTLLSVHNLAFYLDTMARVRAGLAG